jgi:hypothetical protein
MKRAGKQTSGLARDENIERECCFWLSFSREAPNDHNELADVAQVLGKKVRNEGLTSARSSDEEQRQADRGFEEGFQGTEEIQACRSEVQCRWRDDDTRIGEWGTSNDQFPVEIFRRERRILRGRQRWWINGRRDQIHELVGFQIGGRQTYHRQNQHHRLHQGEQERDQSAEEQAGLEGGVM